MGSYKCVVGEFVCVNVDGNSFDGNLCVWVIME